MTLQNQNFINRITAVCGALGFFCFAWMAMNSGHFHEDAYILFKYVESIVGGHGISFSPEQGPAEGATDFLWLILLSGLHFCGISVGAAANILNSLGVLISLLFLNKLSDGSPLFVKLGLIFMSLTILLSSLTYAAAGGFSVWGYAAILLSLIYLFLSQKVYLWHLIPILSLILGLFRPDGLIIGVVFSVMAGVLLFIRKDNFKCFFVSSLVAFIVGLSYFFWRVNYFDSLLPLPLLVKSETTHLLEGWSQNWAWINSTWIVVGFFFMMLALMLSELKCSASKGPYISILLTALPFCVHLFAIGFAHQSQNVGFRFQAPQLVFLYAILIFSITHSFRLLRWRLGLFTILVLFLIYLGITGVVNTRQNFRYLAGRSYINVLPLWFNEQLPKGSLIAVSEAGRLPFWSKNYRFIDLVGLNTSYVAKNGLSIDYLNEQEPSVFFLWYNTGLHDEIVVDVSISTLRELNESNKKKIGSRPMSAVEKASIITADYIIHSDQYDIVSVYYWNSHNHLFAFKKGIIDLQDFKQMIVELSRPEHSYSYAEMQSIVSNGKAFEALYATD